MVLKTFAQLSKQAQLAKNFWTATTNSPTPGQHSVSSSVGGQCNLSSQPAFFVSTSQLPRHQSQLTVRNQSGFGKGPNNESYNAPGTNSAISATFVHPIVFSQHTLLTSLDEDNNDRDDFLELVPIYGGGSRSKNHLKTMPRSMTSSSQNDGFLLISPVLNTHSLNLNPASLDVDRRRFLSTLASSSASSSCSSSSSHTVSHTILEPSRSKVVKSLPKTNVLSHNRKLTTNVIAQFKKPSSTTVNNTQDSVAVPKTSSARLANSPELDPKHSSPLSADIEQSPQSDASRTFSSSSATSSSGSSVHALSLDEYETDKDCAILSDDEADIVCASSQTTIKVPPEVSYDKKLSESPAGKALTIERNNLLMSLAQRAAEESVVTMDYNLDALLDNYFDMLRKKIKPNTDTYTIVISSLITAANHYKYLSKRFPLFDHSKITARHGSRLLPSVREQTNISNDGRSFLMLALDLFAASNSVKYRHYNAKLYESLLECCISYGEAKRLNLITEAFKKQKLTIPTDVPTFYSGLIKGSGMKGDIDSALQFYEEYKTRYHTLQGSKNPLDVYSAVISAFFYSKQSAAAIQFLDKILSSGEPFLSSDMIMSQEFQKVLAAVIDGFTNDGACLDAWNWVKVIEKDKSIPSISLATISTLFSKLCFTSETTTDPELVNEIFDFVASQARCVNDSEFNNIRCDYLMFNIKHDMEENVYKAIRETHLRDGIWEETCLVNVVEYLCSKGKIELALDTFQSQSSRLAQFADEHDILDASKDPFQEALTAVTNIFTASKNMDYYIAGTLACSEFASTEFFMRSSENGQVTLLDSLSRSIKDRSPAYVECLKSSRLLNVSLLQSLSYVINDHVNEKSTPSLEMVKEAYAVLVRDLLDSGISGVRKDLNMLVFDCLQSLGALDLAEQWQLGSLPPKMAVDNEDNVAEYVEFDSSTTRKMVAYTEEGKSLSSLYSELEAVVLRKATLGPEAIVALFELCCKRGSASFLPLIYDRASEMYPPSSSSPQFWDIWVTINRAAIEHGASLDYSFAYRAYLNLRDMGSFPDATGYGRLIAHKPIVATRDEAGDAMVLFQDAIEHNIVPNTYLYNVTLAKLAKARQLKAAFDLFDEMTVRGVKKTSVTYGTLISACCRADQEDRACALFNEMEHSPNYTAKVAPFNTMIQYYVHIAKNKQKALDFYQRLRNAGLKPSSYTYKLLIDCHSLIEPIDLNTADSVLHIIREDHNPVTTQHLAALLYARGIIAKDLKATSIFYKKILMSNRVKPDNIIYQALLEAYVVNNRVAETNEILDDMVHHGVELNAYMTNILIRGWAQLNLTKSIGLFNYLFQVNRAEPSSYESLIRAFILHKDFDSARNVLELMKSNKYPTPVCQKVGSLISKYQHVTSVNEEELLFDSIFRHTSQSLTESLSGHTFVQERGSTAPTTAGASVSQAQRF